MSVIYLASHYHGTFIDIGTIYYSRFISGFGVMRLVPRNLLDFPRMNTDGLRINQTLNTSATSGPLNVRPIRVHPWKT